ncbi:MAG: UDP-3-O-(3-hydroxymyristoyl)glucosamine N-acyltransferase [Sulfurospirillaceae bacterium]|nr:UDP-3-O-(3-hydroxymyristoyl)glucosamine N-acyltransferase [Sulfurospirillaceae bacterium]
MTLKDLADKLDIAYNGQDFEIASFATLQSAHSKNITFFDDAKLLEDLKNTKAKAVLISEKFASFVPEDTQALICDNPHLYMAKASKYFVKDSFSFGENIEIHQNTRISPNVQIGSNSKIEEGAIIYPNVVIGSNVYIGKDTLIYPNVVIYADSVIGSNCILQAGSIIGSDGFGYAHTRNGEHVKIHHSGNVVIEDDVEIGANTTIDKAVFGSTVIKKGTKIDNLVQIAHNCELGEYCLIVSQTGISGSSKLGRNVIMGGQSATAGHLSIGDFATIAARGGVTKTIDGGKVYGGFPLMLQKEWLKKQAKIANYFKKINKRI